MSLSELAAIRKRLEQKRKRETSPASSTTNAAEQVNPPQQIIPDNTSATNITTQPPSRAATSDLEAEHEPRKRRAVSNNSVSPPEGSKIQNSTTRKLSPVSSPHTSDYNPDLSIPASARLRSSIPQHWLPHDTRQSISQDLSQHFVNKGSRGDRPQNFIDVEGDCGDPELECYLARRDQLISQANAAAPYMADKCDLSKADLKQLLQGQEFDVIMIDPPWKEYTERVTVASLSNSNPHSNSGASVHFPSTASPPSPEVPDSNYWDLEAIARLPIVELAAEPCVLFLWCGSGSHVAEGHELLKRWGFHKAEDICWIQTNAADGHAQMSGFADPISVFQRTFEHCIMGIKGREYILRDRDMRNADTGSSGPSTGLTYRERMELGMVQFVAPGCEVDCFVSELEEEESEARSAIVPPHRRSSDNPHNVATHKPLGFYKLIERFCVGRRRLELFGTEHNIRNGWLTLGASIGPEWSNLSMERYRGMFERPLELPPPLPPSHFTDSNMAAVAADTINAVRNAASMHSPRSATTATSSAAAAAAAPFDARIAGHYLTFDSYSEKLRPKSPVARTAPVPTRRPARPRKGTPIAVNEDIPDPRSNSHTSPSFVDAAERVYPRPSSHIIGEPNPRSLSPQPLFDERSRYWTEGAATRAMQDQQQHMLRQSIYQAHR